MRVVRYQGDVIPPTPTASRNGQSDIWIVPLSEISLLPVGAQILAAPASVSAVPARNELPDSHPFKGMSIPTGPFPAGRYPGDIRIVAGGKWEVYTGGDWVEFKEGDQ